MPQKEPQLPTFVLPVGEYVTSDVDEDSDAEEFNSTQDLFEITDQDRRRRQPIEFPEGFNELNTQQKTQWIHQLYLQKLKAVQQSECYKRKTLFKMIHRLQNRTHIEHTFYQVVRRVCPHLVFVQDGSLYDTLQTLCFSSDVVDKYNFLKLAITYGIYNMTGKQKLPLTKEQLMGLGGQLSTNMYVQAFNKFKHQESPETNEMFQKQMTNLCDKFVKFSYVVSMPFMLTNELTLIMKQVIEVKKVFARRNLNLPLVDNKVLQYLVPNYLEYPIRGPFKPHFYGGSDIKSMYGSRPNRNFYYCNCLVDQQVCGHRGIAPVCVRPEFL